MQQILDFFYLIIPNYGIAIILLTLLTKVVFLPLTFKSSESMAKMATLNPKMTEIRTRLKDKPDKMNQEIAELYRREKINPLSGCLPLLLQMPVFIRAVQPAEQLFRAAWRDVHSGLDSRSLCPRVCADFSVRYPLPWHGAAACCRC